jgi:hypothetical protein
MSSRLFELVGVDLATVQFAASQVTQGMVDVEDQVAVSETLALLDVMLDPQVSHHDCVAHTAGSSGILCVQGQWPPLAIVAIGSRAIKAGT